MSMNKRGIIGTIVILGGILIALFAHGLYTPSSETAQKATTSEQQNIDPNQPTLLKTDPSPLNHAILLPSQKITLTFSHPLENLPEMKYSFDPEVEGLVGKLSEDRKTATFSAEKGFPVGQTYHFTIHQNAKFQGGKNLDKQYDFEFKTIDYKGV